MDELIKYLPLIIPVLIIQLILMIIAVVHIVKHDNFKVGSKPMWLFIVIIINIIGPILYFVLGKEDEY